MIAWGLETLVATTILMLVVLALRQPARRAFGPGMAYMLWALPVLRFLLPPLPESLRAQAVTPLADAGEAVSVYLIEPLTQPMAHAATFGPAAAVSPPALDWIGTLIPALFAIWAAGVLGFLGYHLVSHSRFCARLRRSARRVTTVAGGRVHVIETDGASGPLAFGIWRKYVAFPRDFHERYDAQERDLALAHELGHHVRYDLIANWVALVVLAIHWFNPVAWRAFRAFRADQEMACDALVLAGRAPALRHAYGRAIVKSAHGGAVSAACHLHTINDIKGRLRMLTVTRRVSRTRLATGLAGLGALMLVGLGLTASGSQAAECLRTHVEDTIGVDLADLDVLPPVPPAQAAPAAPAARAVPPAPAAPALPAAPAEPPAIVSAPEPEPPAPPPPPAAVVQGDYVHERPRVVVRQPDVPAMPDLADLHRQLAEIPDVRSGNCRVDGKREDLVIHGHDGTRQTVLICTDRIEAQTANAIAIAERSKAAGFAAARRSLEQARASIIGNRALSEEAKADALQDIAEAIRDLDDNERGD